MKDTLASAMAASRDAAGQAAAFNAESPADIAIHLLDLLVTGSEVLPRLPDVMGCRNQGIMTAF